MGKRYNTVKKLINEDPSPYYGERDFKGGWRKKVIDESDWIPELLNPVRSTITSSGFDVIKKKLFRKLVEKESSETVFQVQQPYIKNLKICDDVFDNISNWREELIDEGMSSKDFPDLYGYGISIFDMPITSTIQTPVQSTKAQDIVDASADATDHEFGPQFPGSYRNVVGGVQSLSKVDAQAHLAHASADKAAAAPHDEDHVFAYQSTDFVLPTAEQMTANMTTVASGDFFSNQMKQMIWPSYGQVSPIPGTDIVQGPNGPQVGQLSSYSYPWNNHVYPDDAYFEGLGYDMSNLTAEQQEKVIRDRVSFVGGKYGGVSGTYHKDNHFLDITYGTARSIDETSFDIVAGGIYNWDDPVEWPNLQQLDLGPGWGWEYRSSPGDDHSLTKEHWQYQENGEEFHVSHLEDIIGVTFPAFKDGKYIVDGKIESYYKQPGGFHYDMEESDLPGTNDVNYASAYNECSAHKKVIQNVHAGDIISFNYRIASEEWDNQGGYDITGNGNGPYFDVIEQNELYVVAGKRIMSAWSLHRELPDDECTEEYGFVLRNTESPVDTGTFSYTIQQEDINPVTGALDFVTAWSSDDIYFSRVSITNFAINEGNQTRTAAGQLGKTTDAYDLGTSVASLNPNNKKKKEEEEEEEIFGSEQKELSAKDVELQVKEKQRLENVAAIQSAEEKFMQGINKQVEEATVELDNGSTTWKGEVNSRWDMSAGKFRDMTIDPKNPSQIPGMKGVKWINSLEELENAGTTADMGSNMYASHLRSLIHGRFQNLDREELDKLIKSPAIRADFLARTSPSFRKWILSVPTDRDYSKSGWTLTSKGSGDFFPAYKARGLNVDNLDSVFTGMDIGQRTGWWLPDDGSWKAYQQIKEATRRAWTFFGWSRYSFPGKSDPSDSSNPGPTQDFELEDISWELLKKAERDSNSLTPEELEMIKKYIAQDEKNPEPESSDNDDPYHLNLGQIIKKFGNKVGNELAKIYQKLSTYRHAGEAFANFLLQQQGLKKYTKKKPYNVKLPKEDALALAKTINHVLETQIPKERWNDLTQEDLDKINDAVNAESGPTPTNKYREGTGKNEDEYHNIFNNLGERKGVKVKVINGKPYVTELNDNYIFTDPDDASVQGAPELIKFFTTAGGAQDREDAAGGGEYTYQQWSGDINNLDLKMKNMPIRTKLPIPKDEQDERGNSSGLVREELYPGQPSPNGFPDTPPPKLAPNGYHPKYGRKADRYRRLDSISAKTMDRVKTGDPETDAQVSAAAKSVFKRFNKYR